MKPIYPFAPYKIDQGFGTPTTYGPHEGWDLNRKNTSGDQDCDTPLMAVADGTVVHTSDSTKDYGKLLVLRVETPNGPRFVRYCHCNKTLVKSGLVRSGELIATMGDTGNSTACHLHFDIFKIDPTGKWRSFAKTKAEHTKMFEDPSIFFQTNVLIDEMPQWLTALLKEDLRLDVTEAEGSVRARIGEIKDATNNYESIRKELKTIKEDYAVASGQVEELKEKLRLSDEDRAKLEKEVAEVKELVIRRDSSITSLQQKVETLESQLDPDKVIIITKEEYERLLETKVIKRFKTAELVNEVVRRIFGGR